MFDAIIDQLKEVIFSKIGAVLVAASGAALAMVIWQPLRRGYERWTTPAAPGANVTILVARLEGDANDAQTRHVIQSLRREFPRGGGPAVRVLPFPGVLALGPDDAQAAEAAEAKARDWLRIKNADLLVWGGVAKGSVATERALLRLRLMARDGGAGEAEPQAAGEQTLELPADFGADQGAALASAAVKAIRGRL